MSALFVPGEAGLVLSNPGAVSLDELRLVQCPSKPCYVRFADYKDVMDNFVKVSAMKKVLEEEATHYRELLVLHERYNPSTALSKLEELEKGVTSILVTAESIQRYPMLQLPDTKAGLACKKGFQRLVDSLQELCPVNDLESFMAALSTADSVPDAIKNQ